MRNSAWVRLFASAVVAIPWVFPFANNLNGQLAPVGAVSPTAPSVGFAQTSWDFGVVPRGAQLVHKFAWVNTEQVPLQVLKVDTSCSCVTATAQPPNLQPGREGVIEVVIDAKKFIGHKSVAVQLLIGGGPGNVTRGVTLKVDAHARPDIVFNPSCADFGVIVQGESATRVVDMEYAGQHKLQVLGLDQQPPNGIVVALAQKQSPPGQIHYQIHVTIPSNHAAGDFKHELKLKTNDPNSPTVPLMAMGSIRPPITALPSPVSFGTTRFGRDSVRKVTVRGEKPFQITAIQIVPNGANDPVAQELAAQSSPMTPTVHSLQVSWRPRLQPLLNHNIVVTTNCPQMPQLVIPVQGQAGP